MRLKTRGFSSTAATVAFFKIYYGIDSRKGFLPWPSRFETFKAPLRAILLILDRESEFLLLQCGSVLVVNRYGEGLKKR